MRIDWKAAATSPDPLALYDLIPTPDEIDWSDPTHVPCMVAESVERIGNLSECLSDEEHVELCVAALDAMPRGTDAVVAAVPARARDGPAAHGWSDFLFDPFTGRYPWEPSDGGGVE